MLSVRVRSNCFSADTSHSLRRNPYTLQYTIYSFSPRKTVGYAVEELGKPLATRKDEFASLDAIC